MATATRKPHLGRDLEHRMGRAQQAQGRGVVVVETYANGIRQLREGWVVTVAWADHGTTSELVVLQEAGRFFPTAISLAQVVRIYPRNARDIAAESF